MYCSWFFPFSRAFRRSRLFVLLGVRGLGCVSGPKSDSRELDCLGSRLDRHVPRVVEFKRQSEEIHRIRVPGVQLKGMASGRQWDVNHADTLQKNDAGGCGHMTR